MGERKRRHHEAQASLDGLRPSDGYVHDFGQRMDLGADLRAAREQHGYELADVARDLRIRQAYLHALEDGRFKDLPGAAYATGFLRTYAEHLGLDPEHVLRRFKEESSGTIPKSELYMPKPVPEGRIPGGAVLLLAMVLAGGIYGSWYYLTATGRDIADLVPAVPERLMAALNLAPADPEVVVPVEAEPEAEIVADAAPAAPAPVDTAPAERDEPVSAPLPAQVAQAPVVTEPPDAGLESPPVPDAPVAEPPAFVPVAATEPATTPSETPEPTPAASQPPAEAPGPAVAEPAPSAEPDVTTAQAAPSAALPSETAPAAAPAPTPAPESAATQSAALPPLPSEPPAVPAADAVPADGKVYGVVNGASRVQLRATQDSWVQVRNAAGDLLFARVLRPGDVYRVPDERGLRMVTGNAGGIVVVVDGVAADVPMGHTGQVMRDVTLDPVRLAGG